MTDKHTQDDATREVQIQLATLFSASRRFGVRIAQIVHPELQPSGFYLMRMLERCGPSRPSTLAADFAVDRSAMSRLIQALDELGLIERTPDPQDKRAYMLDLTPDGRERLTAARTASGNPIVDAMEDWPIEDVQTFARLIQRFVTREE